MCMSVDDQVGAMAVHDFGQTRCAQVRKNFRGFSGHRGGNGRVVKNNDAFLGSKLRECALQFEALVDGRLDDGLDLSFAESGEGATAKAANETLGAGKADAVSLVAGAVEDLDTFGGHH